MRDHRVWGLAVRGFRGSGFWRFGVSSFKDLGDEGWGGWPSSLNRTVV